MRIANLPSGRTRRDERREKEYEEHHGPLPADEFQDEPIKPAKVKPGERPPPEVILPPMELFERNRGYDEPLPDQETLLENSIRLRHQVELIMDTDVLADQIEVRHSIIEDMDDEGLLYLAMPSPPILKSHTGTKVQVTFLSRYHDVPGGRWIRVGYHTAILDVIRERELADGVIEPVVVVAPPKKLEASTVRMAYRLIPPEDLDLRLYLRAEDMEVGLMDLSIGGAQFHHPKDIEFAMGSRIALSLLSGGIAFNLTAKVVRQGKTYDVRGRERGVTSVQFGEMDSAIKNQFTRLLTETYRHLLAQRSGVAARREDD
jgi:hypothetical protein